MVIVFGALEAGGRSNTDAVSSIAHLISGIKFTGEAQCYTFETSVDNIHLPAWIFHEIIPSLRASFPACFACANQWWRQARCRQVQQVLRPVQSGVKFSENGADFIRGLIFIHQPGDSLETWPSPI